MVQMTGNKPFKLYTRSCRRCNKRYKTPCKYSKICGSCNKRGPEFSAEFIPLEQKEKEGTLTKHIIEINTEV